MSHRKHNRRAAIYFFVIEDGWLKSPTEIVSQSEIIFFIKQSVSQSICLLSVENVDFKK